MNNTRLEDIKKLFNNSIKSIFKIPLNIYNSILNKVAINSKIYKKLNNKYENLNNIYLHNISICNNLEDIEKTIKQLKTVQIVKEFYGSNISLTGIEDEIAKILTRRDIVVVKNSSAKVRMKSQINNYSEPVKVLEFNELENYTRHLDLQNDKIFVCPSIWVEDMLYLINLLIKIKDSEKLYKLE